MRSSDNREFYDFDYLIMAIPAPQAAILLAGQTRHYQFVKDIKMQACFTLMIGLTQAIDIGFDAAFVNNSILSWIANNSSKIGRPANMSLVINADNDWSEQHIDEDIEVVKHEMLTALNEIIELPEQNIGHIDMQRWRYANATDRKEFSLYDEQLNLGICGDWLVAGKVEGAFISGMDLFSKISA